MKSGLREKNVYTFYFNIWKEDPYVCDHKGGDDTESESKVRE